jgi:hypothetical protein
MSDQSGSSPFERHFESALQDYKHETGITLAQHPLASQLQSCHSVETIAAFLQGQAQALGGFHGSDRIMKSLKSIVSVTLSLSATVAVIFGEVTSLVRLKALMGYSASLTRAPQPLSPVNAIIAGLAVLLAVCSFLYYLSSCVRTFVTPKYIRQPRVLILAMTHSSTCSSPSNTSSIVSQYIRGSLLPPQWTR